MSKELHEHLRVTEVLLKDIANAAGNLIHLLGSRITAEELEADSGSDWFQLIQKCEAEEINNSMNKIYFAMHSYLKRELLKIDPNEGDDDE